MFAENYEKPIGELLDIAAKALPQKEVIFDGKRRISYSELNQQVNELASGLSRLGIKKGDRIGVSLPAWYEFIVLVFAIAKVGGILVPLNTRYREDEVEYIFKDSGVVAVFITKEYDDVNQLSKFLTIQKRVSSLKHIITVRFEHEGLNTYTHLLENGKRYSFESANINVHEDMFTLVYTSGTTGKPKGAMLTHFNLAYSVINSCIAVKAQENDVYLHASPYFHIMGISGILRMVVSRAKAVILEKYKVEEALRLIEQERITIHSGVPTIFILELNHPNFSKYDLSSLRVAIMAGAPCPVEIIRRVKTEMGCPVLVSYGMTETAPLLTFTEFEDDEFIQSETVGKAIKGVELKIVDDSRVELPRGEVGEITARTPGLMKGYYNLPDQTRDVVDDEGWFYTGDLGTMDENGYIRIVGRKKEMLIRGGYNVYPPEIEEAFYEHPAVLEVAIVGFPDTVLGEVSCAVITLKDKNIVSKDELKSYISMKVADYKVPDHIVLVDQLPKTASGKIMKFALKEELLKEKSVSLR